MSERPAATPRIVLEPALEAHDRTLYLATVVAEGVAGFGAVDAAQLAAYRRRGFLVIRGAYSDSDVVAARDELDALTRSELPQCEYIHYEGSIAEHLSVDHAENGRRASEWNDRIIGQTFDRIPDVPAEPRALCVRKVTGFVGAHRALNTMAYKTELLSVLERVVGEPVRLHQDMALVKPPGGREKPWHQDHAYFNLPLETPIVGVWIALHPVNPENGCMVVLPGGHLEGPRPHFMRRDYQICDDDIHQTTHQQRVALRMRAGDALLFDGKLPHGTPTNRTQDRRWAVQYHYVGENAQTDDEIDHREAFGSEGKDVTC